MTLRNCLDGFGQGDFAAMVSLARKEDEIAMRHTAFVGPAGRYAAPEWTRMQAVAMDQRLDGRSSIRPAEMVFKRGLDLLFASVLLAVLLPVMLLIAMLVRRDGGPAVFGHRRIGTDGRTFCCWKFRSMVLNADKALARLLETNPAARAEWEREYKLREDPRVTPIGKILRATSLDELPQLINVIMGEMSLVGPRPIVSDEIRRYGTAFHDYRRCRPGITGKWQVSGRNDTDYSTRVQLDRDYARRWSLGRDLMILLKTVQVVIRKQGAR